MIAAVAGRVTAPWITFCITLSIALVSALTLGLVAAPASFADTPNVDPSTINLSADASLSLTKLEQPQEFGLPTDGLPLSDISGYTPIEGVTFEATKVPLDSPLNTNAGWQQVLTMTLAEAHTRITGLLPSTGITNTEGVVEFLNLEVGLYYLEETATPPGVVPSAPMLVVLPVQHPTTVATWVYDVSIYPKNATLGVTLSVDDAAAVTLGDVVNWSSRSTIPRASTIDEYVVTNTLAAGLSLVTSGGNVQVQLAGTHGIVLDDDDFTVTTVGQVITVAFTATGLVKLGQAREADPNAAVNVSYSTTVQTEGELQSTAQVASASGGAASPAISAQAVTKWGELGVTVQERDNPSHRIPGAKFQLFLTAADSAARLNPITVEGVNEWVTDAQGQIIIHGLRFSDFVNGLDRSASDPLFRTYYAIMTEMPSGYRGTIVPIAVNVDSTSEVHFGLVELWRAGDLPVTGGQLAGGGILAALLLGGGIMLFLRRRREHVAAHTRA